MCLWGGPNARCVSVNMSIVDTAPPYLPFIEALTPTHWDIWSSYIYTRALTFSTVGPGNWRGHTEFGIFWMLTHLRNFRVNLSNLTIVIVRMRGVYCIAIFWSWEGEIELNCQLWFPSWLTVWELRSNGNVNVNSRRRIVNHFSLLDIIQQVVGTVACCIISKW